MVSIFLVIHSQHTNHHSFSSRMVSKFCELIFLIYFYLSKKKSSIVSSKDLILTVGKQVHTPWCISCETTSKHVEKLAKHFKGLENLVFARIDASTNEHPKLQVSAMKSCIIAILLLRWVCITFKKTFFVGKPCFSTG